MGRKRKAEDAGDTVPEHMHEFGHKHKRRRGRRLAFLLAVAGGVMYAMRRRQQSEDADEGVWHEAPNA
jgi:hypothetical protein